MLNLSKSMLITASAWATVSLVFCAGPGASHANVINTSFNHGSTYHYTGPLGPNPRNSIVSIDMNVEFTNPFGGGLKTRAGKTSTFKLPPVSPLSTRVVSDQLRGDVATAQATATFIADEGPLIFSLHAGLRTAVRVPPGWRISGNSYTSDPLTSLIAGPGTLVTMTESLLAGTTIEGHSPAFPDLAGDLFGRYGIGGQFQASDPETLWGTPDDQSLPAPAPAGAFDLFRIHIFDNDSGVLTAVATGTTPASPLDATFSRSLDQIESIIEDMTNWSHQPDGSWVLNRNLDLFELTLTNDRADLNNAQFSIGTFSRTSFGDISPIPEPSTFMLLNISILSLVLCAWRPPARAEVRSRRGTDSL